MNSYQPVRISQNVPTQYYGQGGDIPGVSQVTPFYPQGTQNSLVPAVTKPDSAGSLLSNLNFKEIKGFIDRMGGVEGLMGTLQKVQKTVQTIQQMGPMLKLLLPKFGKSASVDDDEYTPRRHRRRRRRRQSGALNKRRKPTNYDLRYNTRRRPRPAMNKRKNRNWRA